MAKRMIKILAVVLVAIMVVTVFATVVKATTDQMTFEDAGNTATVTKDAKDTSGAASSINRILGSILTMVQIIGSGVAVIMLIVLAIKYISAAPGDKADIKKHAVVYVVGAVVLFAASGILQIVKRFAANVNV